MSPRTAPAWAVTLSIGVPLRLPERKRRMTGEAGMEIRVASAVSSVSRSPEVVPTRSSQVPTPLGVAELQDQLFGRIRSGMSNTIRVVGAFMATPMTLVTKSGAWDLPGLFPLYDLLVVPFPRREAARGTMTSRPVATGHLARGSPRRAGSQNRSNLRSRVWTSLPDWIR